MGNKGKGMWLLGSGILLGGGFLLGRAWAREQSPASDGRPSTAERLGELRIQREKERLRRAYEHQDRVRRDFTANVSHELKTPLTSISGYAEIIREGLVKSEDVGPFAGKIYEEAQRLITLVEDILNLSRLDEGAPPREEMVRVDLYHLCEEAIAALSEPARQRGIRMTLSGQSQFVEGSEKILREIVYNLCDNAVKYNKEQGRVDVTVTQEGKRVALYVEDTGIGIAPEETERVFERFYRVDKSHSKEIGGTGLGLSIVKHAAACHDAKVLLDSQLGKGTCVGVYFHPAGEVRS